MKPLTTFLFDKGQLKMIPLPEKPQFSALELLSPAVDTDSQIKKYNEACAYARAHPIDVDEKDVDKISILIWQKHGEPDHNYKDWKSQDLTEYSVEVRMEIKETCIRNGDRLDCANEACWDLNECQRSPSKQIAVLLNN